MHSKFLCNTNCVPIVYIDLCSVIDHSSFYILFIVSFYSMNMRFYVLLEISMKHIYVTLFFFFHIFLSFGY